VGGSLLAATKCIKWHLNQVVMGCSVATIEDVRAKLVLNLVEFLYARRISVSIIKKVSTEPLIPSVSAFVVT
jgi:hypothetical protein